MHAALRLPVALALLPLAAPSPVPQSVPTSSAKTTRYLPATIDTAFEEWIGGQLAAMGEPVLSTRGAGRGFAARYRLLVMPSFTPAYALRIDVPQNGRAAATVTVLDGAGGYAPGKPARVTHSSVSSADADILANRLGALRFPKRAFKLWHRGKSFWDSYGLTEFGARAGPGDVVRQCCDGTQFVIEAIGPAGYHAITRHQCQLDKDTRSLVVALLKLGGIKPDRADIGL